MKVMQVEASILIFLCSFAVSLRSTLGNVPTFARVVRSRTLSCCAVPGDADRLQLEHLFNLRECEAEEVTAAGISHQPGILNDVALFRPGWTALPGFTHEILVTAPHYVHMFEQLTAAAAAAGTPAIFGHLQMQNASCLLAAGSRMLAVGVVMRVVSVNRLNDGGLVVMACGTSRFRTLRARRSTTFSRSDLMLLPDLEEISEVRDWPKSVELPAQWRAEATRAAAAEVSYMWAQAEAAQAEVVREREGGISATASLDVGSAPDVSAPGWSGPEHRYTDRSYMDYSIKDHGLADEQTRGSEGLSPFNVRLSIPRIKQEAHAIATAAAEAVVAQALADLPPQPAASKTDDILSSHFGTSVDGMQRAARLPRYTIMRVPRGLFSARGPPAGRAFLLALEQAFWTELISCLRLSHGSTDCLPESLLLLVPPAPKAGWSVPMPQTSAGEWLRRWDYPPVRRAQRLSFLMATMLPKFDRQRLLEASSVRERLQLGVVYLGEMRRRLVATRLIQTVPGFEDRGASFGI